jgi:chemotaxis protein CheD
MMAALPGISIQPGQLYVAREPMILQTILGSCVGVTFWSARLGAGALCHGVLPRCPQNVHGAEGHRYVDFSVRYLAEQFDALGACRQELEVKLFGGADVLPVAASNHAKPTIGDLNCRAALEALEAEGLRVAASDLGGNRGRTIHFDTETGAVFVHRLTKLGNAGRRNNDPARSKRNRMALP